MNKSSLDFIDYYQMDSPRVCITDIQNIQKWKINWDDYSNSDYENLCTLYDIISSVSQKNGEGDLKIIDENLALYKDKFVIFTSYSKSFSLYRNDKMIILLDYSFNKKLKKIDMQNTQIITDNNFDIYLMGNKLILYDIIIEDFGVDKSPETSTNNLIFLDIYEGLYRFNSLTYTENNQNISDGIIIYKL